MKRSVIAASIACGAVIFASQGCGAGEVQIAQENGALYGGVIDAGTGVCGGQTCAAGQLCCAGTDEYCSPTCMTTTICPKYGRPCKFADAGGTPDAGGITEAGSIEAGLGDAGPPVGQLQWYWTCGYPVCHPSDGGVDGTAGCAPAGTPCTTKGATCGTPSDAHCGATLVCEDHDPTATPYGCPISTAKYKQGIHYLTDAELQGLHDETLATRLATYEYTPAVSGGVSGAHLGFIIEDQPKSLAVDGAHDRVDLYGYVSMVVATMQVQNAQIERLERELADTRAACGARK